MHFDICKLAACTSTWRTVRLSEPVTSRASQEYAYDRSGSVKKEGENAEFYFWNTDHFNGFSGTFGFKRQCR